MGPPQKAHGAGVLRATSSLDQALPLLSQTQGCWRQLGLHPDLPSPSPHPSRLGPEVCC